MAHLRATYYFIVLLIGSTCFGHYYAHHQELATIMLIISGIKLVLFFSYHNDTRSNKHKITTLQYEPKTAGNLPSNSVPQKPVSITFPRHPSC